MDSFEKVETLLYETSAPVYDHSDNIEMLFLPRSGLDLVPLRPVSNTGGTLTAESCAVNVGTVTFLLYL